MLVNSWGEDACWNLPEQQDAEMKEAAYLRLNSNKSTASLGWHPKWELEQGIELTVAWYKAHLNKNDMLKVTQQQISAYMQDC
jgi:nucleoside-diphosphate-sugar epimerase